MMYTIFHFEKCYNFFYTSFFFVCAPFWHILEDNLDIFPVKCFSMTIPIFLSYQGTSLDLDFKIDS
jgi:hypothetical protein